MMIEIKFPPPDFKIKTEKEVDYIFDTIRKKWIVLTPEEWVRQNFIQSLVKVKKYPASLIALEKEIVLGEIKKRFDILVYNKEHQPWIMIECKATHIPLNEEVLNQILRYHISVASSYLVITNGNFTYGWEKTSNKLQDIVSLPDFISK